MSQNDSMSSAAFSNASFIQREAAGDRNPPLINITEDDEEEFPLGSQNTYSYRQYDNTYSARSGSQPQSIQQPHLRGPSNRDNNEINKYNQMGSSSQASMPMDSHPGRGVGNSFAQSPGGSKITST
jgi:hypothetical protein